MTTRRRLLIAAAAAAAASTGALAAGLFQRTPTAAAAAEVFEVSHSEAEWRSQLTQQQYAVLREENTEPSGSSPLDKEHRDGTFVCAGCALPLYSSTTKFESGTGWPSFYEPLEKAIATRKDGLFGITRTEVHCRRCGGHLGHVFTDGPRPTGLRYCMNGLALKFNPKAA